MLGDNPLPIAYFTTYQDAVDICEAYKRVPLQTRAEPFLVSFYASENQWNSLMQKGRIEWANLVASQKQKEL